MKTSISGRDLLTLGDLTPDEVMLVLDTAIRMKGRRAVGNCAREFECKAAALIFQKPSMRTRVSFEVACGRLGIQPIVLAGTDSAFSRNETVHDTTKVLERYVDVIVIRTFDQALLEEMAEVASVPIVNALTDDHHPCQGLADLLTIREHLGHLEGVRFAYVGDGNNMAHTYLLAGALTGMHVTCACPDGFMPRPAVVERAREIAVTSGAELAVVNDPREAVAGANVIATDTWASMGQEDEHAQRKKAFECFTVDSTLLSLADSGALFMHCLPAHRGEEVLDEVIDAPCSIVFDEAENRLHAQQALLSLLLGE
ncbi:MAG: ornithine carbamoyltransferase [Actinomycetota bacterium]|nr:ornithine carbamoyltransferase [Actinomycetota bacterium]